MNKKEIIFLRKFAIEICRMMLKKRRFLHGGVTHQLAALIDVCWLKCATVLTRETVSSLLLSF